MYTKIVRNTNLMAKPPVVNPTLLHGPSITRGCQCKVEVHTIIRCAPSIADIWRDKDELLSGLWLILYIGVIIV